MAAAGGAANAAIAAKLGIHVDTVRRWRRRFATENIENIARANDADFEPRPVVAMLDDRARSGRPRIYGPADRVKIVAAVTGELPETDSRWSHTLLAQHLHLTSTSTARSTAVSTEVAPPLVSALGRRGLPCVVGARRAA